MTNILVPLAYYWMVVGRTINIVNYEFGVSSGPIYNETDVVENTLSSFNASYYVLPDENIPYEKVRVPVDYLLRARYEGNTSYKKLMLNGYRQLISRNTDNALVLVVAECKTSEKTMKENAIPTPNWQDHIRDRQQTHYADKVVYGGQVISLVRLRSMQSGDVQVFRRILKDVMGTSGSVTADTVELWKKAEKAIRESSDIRGEIFIDHYTEIINARSSAFEGKIENLFRYVSELPKHTGTSRDDRTFRKPLYVSFKPLHDLDQRYPSVQKDVEGERYLTQLYPLLRDLEFTDSEKNFFLRLISVENQQKYRDFRTKLRTATEALKKVFYTSLSSYETIDKTAFQEAFKQYQQGLDNSTVNYLAQFRRVREQIGTGITCGSEFYTPTSGMLRVLDNEVVKKGRVDNFEKCRDFCVRDEQCRAVGYSDQECLVYYRSTDSAVITSPSGDMKIYDRKCRFKFDDVN